MATAPQHPGCGPRLNQGKAPRTRGGRGRGCSHGDPAPRWGDPGTPLLSLAAQLAKRRQLMNPEQGGRALFQHVVVATSSVGVGRWRSGGFCHPFVTACWKLGGSFPSEPRLQFTHRGRRWIFVYFVCFFFLLLFSYTTHTTLRTETPKRRTHGGQTKRALIHRDDDTAATENATAPRNPWRSWGPRRGDTGQGHSGPPRMDTHGHQEPAETRRGCCTPRGEGKVPKDAHPLKPWCPGVDHPGASPSTKTLSVGCWRAVRAAPAPLGPSPQKEDAGRAVPTP